MVIDDGLDVEGALLTEDRQDGSLEVEFVDLREDLHYDESLLLLESLVDAPDSGGDSLKPAYSFLEIAACYTGKVEVTEHGGGSSSCQQSCVPESWGGIVGYYVGRVRCDVLKGGIIKIVEKGLVLNKWVKGEDIGGVGTQHKEIFSSQVDHI